MKLCLIFNKLQNKGISLTEMIRSIRLAALLNSLYVYVLLLIACTLLINGVEYFRFMAANLVLFPIIYVILFSLEMRRYNKMSEDEE